MSATIDTGDRPDDLITLAEACRLIPSRKPGKHLRIEALYRWLREGKLRRWRVGHYWHVSKADVLALPQYYPPAPEVERQTKRRLEVEAAKKRQGVR